MMLKIFTDGGARGNPGPAAIGVVVLDEHNTKQWQVAKVIGVATNNIAEYMALKAAFEYLVSLPSPPTAVAFYLDSLLVVQQMKGVYKIKEPSLQTLKAVIDTLRTQLLCPISFTHVPRAQNTEADRLVNQALDLQVGQD